MATVETNQNILTTTNKNVIINTKEVGRMDLQIDKFTPCLKDTATEEIVPTTYSLIGREELKSIKDWKFNWNDRSLNDAEVYKLTLKNDDNQYRMIIDENSAQTLLKEYTLEEDK